MPVMNGVEGDSRVIKTAKSLISNGYKVLVVGYTASLQNNGGYFERNDLGFPCILISGFSAKGKFPETKNIFYARQLQLKFYVHELLNLCVLFKAKLLYTHDMSLIKAGALIKKFTNIKWVHDLHEWVKGLSNIDKDTQMFSIMEEEYGIGGPDHLFTVSDSISKIYKEDYKLKQTPTVIYNAPYKLRKSDDITLRDELNLNHKELLAVYVGNVKPARGVIKFIPCLQKFENLHIALVTNNKGPYIEEIKALAREMNAENRLHIKPYVPVDKLPHYISTASFGFHTMPRYGNGDVALPNKLFEYIQSGIPVAVSDATDMKKFVKKNKCGVCFSDDEVSLFESISNIIENLNIYRPTSELRNRYNWENEEKKIIAVVNQFIESKPSKSINFTREEKKIGVLHGLTHAAGQPYALSRVLNSWSKKFKAKSLSIAEHKFGASSDLIINNFRLLRAVDVFTLLEKLREEFKIFHLHARSFFWSPPSYVENFSDLAFIKSIGGKIVFNFRGTEARIPSEFSRVNKYSYSDHDPLGTKEIYNDESIKKLIDNISKYADKILVPDEELKHYVKGASILPRTILSTSTINQPRNKNFLRILHAPSNSGVKGTDIILQAVEDLKNEGFEFKFILLKNKNNKEVIDEISKADLVIDQILIGSYGVFSVEALSLGKPIICYLNETIFTDDHPFISANPENIKNKLKKVLNGEINLQEYQKKSKKYFEQNFTNSIVCEKLTSYYEEALSSDLNINFKFEFQKIAKNHELFSKNSKRNESFELSSQVKKLGLPIDERNLSFNNESVLNDSYKWNNLRHEFDLLNSIKNTFNIVQVFNETFFEIKKNIKRLLSYIKRFGYLRGIKKFTKSRLSYFIRKYYFQNAISKVPLRRDSAYYDIDLSIDFPEIVPISIIQKTIIAEFPEVNHMYKRALPPSWGNKMHLKKRNRGEYYTLLTKSCYEKEFNDEFFDNDVKQIEEGGYLIIYIDNYDERNSYTINGLCLQHICSASRNKLHKYLIFKK